MPLPEIWRASCVTTSEGRDDRDGGDAAGPAEETTAVSEFAPSSIVIVWPLRKPIALTVGRTVAPASVEVRNVVAPAVPTAAMTAVSIFAPESIWTVWPGRKPSVLATLMFVAPAADVADK